MVGQTQVEQDQVGTPGLGLRDAIFGSERLMVQITLRRERCPQEAPDLWIVFYNQDVGFSHKPPNGRRIRNTAPPPVRLKASIVPR